MNARQQKIYDGLLKLPPENDHHALGAAYWLGRRNPKMRVDDAGPVVGAPGSDARVAFRAGKRAALPTTSASANNPFRTREMRKAFEDLVSAYTERRKVLFLRDGTPNKGNSPANVFWMGFKGQNVGDGFADRASREMLAYAHWRAGKACASLKR